MDYFHSNDNVSSASDADLSREDSFCNQELLMPKLRSRKLTNCFQGREYQKENIYQREQTRHSTINPSEGRNMDIRKSNIPQPTIVEREIKVVKDRRLRLSVPSIENTARNVQVVKNGINKGRDSMNGELSEFLTYPVNIENLKIPPKRELHRLIHHRLCNYMNPDIMLVIDEHEFFCHRIVLQSYSKYFDSINNLQDDNIVTIKEKGVTKEAFVAIYAWMLSLKDNGLKYITRDNFVEVLMASQFLQIRDLEEQCLALLDSKEVFFEGYAYQLFQQASKLGQTGIKELMVPRIQHFFLPFVSTVEFVELPLEDVCTFISSSYIVVHSEMEVFMSAARWLLEKWSERKQHLPKVMNCVRFGLMNPLELVDIRKNPESPEFLKITEDNTIQKYIDDGLAYSTYCAMKGSTEDLTQRCQLLGIEIPQPRNWSDTSKCYKSYGEFLNYLKQIKTNPLRIIEGMPQSSSGPCAQASYPINMEESSFQLDFSSPLQTFTEGIPSMSDLLSAGLRHKARRDKQKEILNLNDKLIQEKRKVEPLYLTGSKTGRKNDQNSCMQKHVLIKTPRKEPSLRSKAATIIQAAYRGYRVRNKLNFSKKFKQQKFMESKNRYNKHIGSDILMENGEDNHQNNRLIKNSSLDIKYHVKNKYSQVTGSLYSSQSSTILIFGGLNPEQPLSQCNDGKAVFRYSLDSSRWERVSCLPRGRYYHNATFLKGKVYVMGGVDPRLEEQRQTCICSDMWSFNPSNCEWFKEISMTIPRKNFGLVEHQGYLYAIGGEGLSETILNSVERYDPVKRIWETVSSLPEPRLSPAVASFGGCIWVAGGMGNIAVPTMSTQVYAFEPHQNMWLKKPSLCIGKAFSVMVSCDEKLFLVGGAEKEKEHGCSVSSNSIEVYDPKKNKWEVCLQMRTPRHSHTSAIIDNCLYIMGGTTTQHMKNLNDVETWCLENKSLRRHVPSLPAILIGHAAITLPTASEK